MQLNLESSEQHAVQAYSLEQVKINHQFIRSNLLVDRHIITTDWPISHLSELSLDNCSIILRNKPEIILIGCEHRGERIDKAFQSSLAATRIAIEIMSIGAACRTYNVLLGEYRPVALGILF